MKQQLDFEGEAVWGEVVSNMVKRGARLFRVKDGDQVKRGEQVFCEVQMLPAGETEIFRESQLKKMRKKGLKSKQPGSDDSDGWEMEIE